MMKKKVLFFAAALTALIFGVSCTQNTEEPTPTGSMALTINWAAETRAQESTNVVPITTWGNNIKSLHLLLVNGVGNIAQVYPLTPPTSNDAAAQPQIIHNVPAASYTAYLVANADPTVTTTPFGAGKIVASPLLGGLPNTPISGFLFNLVASTGSNVGGDTNPQYDEPTEIFLARTSVTVAANTTNATPYSFLLKRAVSLLRVRINLNENPTDGSIDNSDVSFTAAGKVATRLRNHGTRIRVNGAAGSTPPWGIEFIPTPTLDNTFYSERIYKTTVPVFDPAPGATHTQAVAGGGTPTMGLGTDFTLWNEFLILPGGGDASSGAAKFNVALTGSAPAGYIPVDTNGNQLAACAAGDPLTWVGQIEAIIEPGKILELNLTLKNRGIGGVVPPADEFGNLSISVTLEPWYLGPVVNQDI